MSNNIANYTFLSWFRRGLSAALDEPDALVNKETSGDRSVIDLTVKIRSAGKDLANINQKVTLLGWGDIIGIDLRAVIKTEPRAGTSHFEPNYLPYIEFYDEDFPWRYSPLSANGDRLRPWIALVILEENEFEHLGLTNTRLPSIRIASSALPEVLAKPDQNWAWAHSHFNTSLSSIAGTGSIEEKVSGLLASNPDVGCSRILCPRRLKPRKNYTGFLIPAFEQGRLAGLGADNEKIKQQSKQQSAWGHEHSFAAEQFPVYYQWSFRTGAAGDFESLARRIIPRDDLDKSIGKQIIDIQSPGYGLYYAGGVGVNKGTVVMEGALRIPNNTEPPLTSSTKQVDKQFVTELATLINLEEDLKERTVAGKFSTNPFFANEKEVSIYDDPIITVPFYGKHHVLQNRIEINTNWYNQLNLEPKYRMAAGLGTEVVQTNQEDLMLQAWRQFGDIIEANQRIRQQQLSLELSQSLFRKHFKTNAFQFKPPDLTVMTSLIHSKVKNGEKTVYGAIDENRNISNGFAHPTYIRMTRKRGPLMRRLRSRKNKVIFSKTAPIWTNWGIVGARTFIPLTSSQFTPLFAITTIRPFTILAKPFQDHFQRGKTLKPQVSTSTSGINLQQINKNVLNKIDPQLRIQTRITSQLTVSTTDNAIQFESAVLNQIMAAPSFPEPMYKALSKLSNDYIVPNLDKIPMESFCLFENNENFIESYLVGLNHEMARELLWREYPTDQRGTYFKQFWDVTDNFTNPTEDINPIHRWPKQTPLADTSHSPGNVVSELVFAIRAQLLEKYPNTIVYMHKADWKNKAEGTRKLAEGTTNMEFPQFDARINPDISFFGFNKTVVEALGDKNDPGWFFVLKERSGELRFGLDLESEPDQTTWDNLSWQDFPELTNYIDLDRDIPSVIERQGIVWGKGAGASSEQPTSGNGNASSMAWILFQKPFQVAIHASELLTKA